MSRISVVRMTLEILGSIGEVRTAEAREEQIALNPTLITVPRVT